MPKKRKAAKRSEPLPAGFWLSPGGAVVPINVHAEALIQMPGMFRLDRAPHGKDEINRTMEAVMRAGWIRGRMLGPGVLGFQLVAPTPKMISVMYDFVVMQVKGVQKVAVETVDPMGYWYFEVGDFLAKAFPSAWRANPRRAR